LDWRHNRNVFLKNDARITIMFIAQLVTITDRGKVGITYIILVIEM